MELVTSEQRRTKNLVKHLRWRFFVKIVNGFKPLIIFTKKLHLRCLARSWIRLYRRNHLRGVLENRCSEICSQNPWKIPMKKFIFSKVAGWRSELLVAFPEVFKEICENRFSPVSFLGKNFRERDCATLLKTNFFKDIFQGFWLKISPGQAHYILKWKTDGWIFIVD